MRAPERAERVVCVGVVTMDTLVLLDRYPDADERVEASRIEVAGGGPAANAAVVLARQGVPVTMIGRVSDDDVGRAAIASLEAEGVDVSCMMVRPDLPTQRSCILIDRVRRTRAICTLGVGCWESLPDELGAVVRRASWVHTDHLGFGAVAAALDGVRERPIVSLDAGNPVRGLDLGAVDLYVPTASAIREFTGVTDIDAAAGEAMRGGAGAVVVTDGGRGAFAWWSGSSAAVGAASAAGTASRPALDGVDVVSTLGAGDVFHGALVSALVRGRTWTESLEDANITAGLSTRALDGRSAVPGLAELAGARAAYLHQFAHNHAIEHETEE